MKKTLIIYGALAVILFLQFAMLHVTGMPLGGEVGMLLLAVNGILFVVAALVDPFGLLCVLLAWIPFRRLLEFEIGFVTFNPFTIGIIFLALSVILQVIVGKKKFLIGRTDIFIILLSFTYLGSTVMSKTLQLSGFLAFHAIFIPVVSYIAIKGMVQTDEQYRKLIFFFVAGIVAYAGYSILQFDFGSRSVVLDIPVISAAAMFVLASITILGLGWARRTTGKISAGVALLAFLGTLSRGYMLLLMVAPFFWRLIRKGKSRGLMLSFLVGSLIATLLLAYNAEVFRPGGGYDKSEQITTARLTNINFWKLSIYGRAHVYRAGLEELPKRPLFGRGMHRPEEHNVRHNFHVEWLEYGGIVGYLLYCLLLYTHYSSMARHAREDRYVAVNLLVLFLLIFNGLTNSFTVGIAPYYGFMLMALNEARKGIYIDRIMQQQRSA